MRCVDCKCSISQDQADQVSDSFDFDATLCFACAEERWKDDQQCRAANGDIVQDGLCGLYDYY